MIIFRNTNAKVTKLTSHITVLEQVISNKPFIFQMYNSVCPSQEGVRGNEDLAPPIHSTSPRLGEEKALRSCRPTFHWMGGCVGPTESLGVTEKGKSVCFLPIPLLSMQSLSWRSYLFQSSVQNIWTIPSSSSPAMAKHQVTWLVGFKLLMHVFLQANSK